MWPAIQAKILHWRFPTILQQQPDRLYRQSADRQRAIHSPGQFPEFARFQEPKHLNELAATDTAQLTFQASPQDAKALG